MSLSGDGAGTGMVQADTARPRVSMEIASLIDRATTDAFVFADADGRIIHWNPAAEAMFGWTAAEALGRNLDLVVPDRFGEAHRAGVRRVVAGGPPKLIGGMVEVPAVHRDGREFPIELSLSMWRDPATGRPAGFASIIRDISARRILEEESARTRALLDTVVEHLPTMLFVKDAATRRYLLINQGASN